LRIAASQITRCSHVAAVSEITRTRGLKGVTLVDSEQHAEFLADPLDDIGLLRIQLERGWVLPGLSVGARRI